MCRILTYTQAKVGVNLYFIETESQRGHTELAESWDLNLHFFFSHSKHLPRVSSSSGLNLRSPLLREGTGAEVRGPWENVKVVPQGSDCRRRSTGLEVPGVRFPSGSCNHPLNNLWKILTHLF